MNEVINTRIKQIRVPLKLVSKNMLYKVGNECLLYDFAMNSNIALKMTDYIELMLIMHVKKERHI